MLKRETHKRCSNQLMTVFTLTFSISSQQLHHCQDHAANCSVLNDGGRSLFSAREAKPLLITSRVNIILVLRLTVGLWPWLNMIFKSPVSVQSPLMIYDADQQANIRSPPITKNLIQTYPNRVSLSTALASPGMAEERTKKGIGQQLVSIVSLSDYYWIIIQLD